MNLACQQDIFQADSNSIIVHGVFSWHALYHLVKLNQLLIWNCYIHLLYDHLKPFGDFKYPYHIMMF